MNRTAFITGITGQDGAYLAQFLLEKGYAVHGMVRWDAGPEGAGLDELGIRDRITFHYGDMSDANTLTRLVKEIRPDEIYNLAALSHVKVSFETPASAFEANAKGTLNLLETLRILDLGHVRFYQASSSEMFGSSPPPQNEETPFAPCSPYGVAKLAAYWLVKTYREAYALHVSNGILFNHESPLRGEDFVTRKITKAVAAIEAGHQDCLVLGNLDAIRDWGHARDYVEGMWLMLRQDQPGDFVLATGQTCTVREFVTKAFAHIGVSLVWKGKGPDEAGVCKKTKRVQVRVNRALFRPMEVHNLQGDSSKAKKKIGWKPKVTLDSLVAEMVNADREHLNGGRHLWQMAG